MKRADLADMLESNSKLVVELWLMEQFMSCEIRYTPDRNAGDKVGSHIVQDSRGDRMAFWYDLKARKVMWAEV